MSKTLPAGEPTFGPWHTAPLSRLLDRIRSASGGQPADHPLIVAIDGRGAAGKSTLARALHRHVQASSVVHTDDIAWHEPLFAWGHLLRDHVLRPLREGEAVRWRPPQWEARDRDGLIEVGADVDLVVVEGVGASHREHAELLDATIWVQADFVEAERRGIARDIAEGVNGGPDEATAFWHHWMAAELAFFDDQRPWERACAVVLGTPAKPAAPGFVVLAT